MNNLQRNEDWFKQRIGHLTASMAGNVIRYQKGEIVAQTPAKVDGLTMRILSEQLTGLQTEDHFTADARRRMEWGTEQEENALSAYELATGHTVLLSGFVKHESIQYLGASPDGLVSSDGLIEIKCPDTTTHLSRILADEVPEEIKPQMLMQ
ncbi:lambda exonuclease family protein, partial [Succinivibrio sp.]|uniref:lambda exonuclease family protein n=1 Tax=Succinivibrio sp. TaxID=2053619 RepID=UPI00386AF6FC